MAGWAHEDRLLLNAALEDRDDGETQRLCEAFIASARSASPPDAADALFVLKQLQGHRCSRLVCAVADAVLESGSRSARVRHLYALAELDRGEIGAAERILLDVPEDVRNRDPEIRGAFGRIGKDRYLAAVGPSPRATAALADGIAHYVGAYREDPDEHIYQGINAAALLCRAARDGVELSDWPDAVAAARAIAEDVMRVILAKEDRPAWDCATAAEAQLVLDRPHDAIAWLIDYLAEEAAPFAINSTLRQLLGLWQLDPGHSPDDVIIALLRAELMKLDGVTVLVPVTDASPGNLARLVGLSEGSGDGNERILHEDALRTLTWFAGALEAARSVARLENSQNEPLGTGFVLDGRFAGRTDWPERVLLTAAHVVAGHDPGGLRVTFWGVGGQKRLSAAGLTVLWIDEGDIDGCVLELPAGCEDLAPLSVRDPFPHPSAFATTRAYVVGHAAGREEACVSMDGSELSGVEKCWALYPASTTQGNSGGPVFDSEWRVMALHKGQHPGTSKNRGVRLDSLIDRLAAD